MPPGAGTDGSRELKRLGWEGIVLTVPSDWELISTHGDHDAGYIALADNSSMRLQVRWETPRGAADPSDVADRYIRELRKKSKKDDAEMSVRRPLPLASLRGKRTECYEWIGAGRGAGMVSHCEQCGRLVHVMVLGETGDALRGLARRLFASLRDHADEDDPWLLWQFYDVEFRSPPPMRLHRRELMTGCVRMTFRNRRRELEFVRASLAEMLLARKSLRNWAGEFYASELRHWRLKPSEATIKGHPGVRAEAMPWLALDPGRLIGRPRLMRIACWHCEETNRLLMVRHTGGRRDQETFDRALEGMRCCGKAP